jgi:hypothetical protein
MEEGAGARFQAMVLFLFSSFSSAPIAEVKSDGVIFRYLHTSE